MTEQITVYTTGPSCGKCSMTKAMLKGKGVEFDEVDITQNPAAYEYVTAELGYTVAPVVVVDDDDHWGDLRPDHIERVARLFGAARGAS